MKIVFISTYLPKQCGIATYTDYLIHGIEEVDSRSEIIIVAGQGAPPIEYQIWRCTMDYLGCLTVKKGKKVGR